MKHSYDVIVIGSGVIGASAAYHLARDGARVLVLERDTVGGRATRAAAGMLAAQMEGAEDEAFLARCLGSRSLFQTLVPEVAEASGIDPEYVVTGLWRLAEDEPEAARLAGMAHRQSAQGWSARWLSSAEARPFLPGVKIPFGAFLAPEDGMINPVLWTRSLTEASRRRGVRFAEFKPVSTLETEGRRVTGVRVGYDLFSAEKVVVASGAWAPALLAPLGLAFPLEPVKGEILIYAVPPDAFRAPMYAGNGYLAPRRDGRVLVGATSERAGFNERPTENARKQLMAWVSRWCPYLAGATPVGVQVGLRPGSADGKPLVGPAPGWEGLVLALGHHRNGILLSPLTGLLTAAVCRGDLPAAAVFPPGRFSHREEAQPV
jgi:glycine oxidase